MTTKHNSSSQLSIIDLPTCASMVWYCGCWSRYQADKKKGM